MTEQTKVKPTYSGICKFCRGEFEKSKMSQHLKNCKERSRMEAETAKSTKGKKFVRTKLFHIMLEGKYNPQYWMHIEMPAEAQLIHLDDFIRAAWVECCDHLSAFQIGEFYYESEPPSFDLSSIKILTSDEEASMEVNDTTSEDTEDDEDYDKFDLEE